MILVLPGTKWSEGLCKKIKDMKKEVLLVSPEKHPYCEKYADDFLRTDIFDLDSIEKYCRKKSIEAIVSDECDIAMPIVAELGERLNIKTLNKEMAALYTDKFLMRDFLEKNGFCYPEYKLCHTVEEAVGFFCNLGKDVILKPLDSNCSKGVFRISTVEELKKLFSESLAFSRVDRAVLVERYIKGPEFTVDGVKTPDKHFSLAISKKKHYSHNENIANELFFTHYDEEYDYERLRSINDRFVELSGYEYGFTHAEYKYEDGNFYLIEIAARGGGNQISSVITQFMSDKDTYRYLIDSSLGNVFQEDFSVQKKDYNKAAVLHFFSVPYKGGKVTDIIGLENLQRNPYVLDYGLNFKINDIIRNADNDAARIGYYIAGANNKNDLVRVINNIEQEFQIIVE